MSDLHTNSTWNEYIAVLIVSAVRNLGQLMPEHIDLLVKYSHPYFSRSIAENKLRAVWLSLDHKCFPLPPLDVTEEEHEKIILPLVREFVFLATENDEAAESLLEDYEWYVGTYWEFRDALAEYHPNVVPMALAARQAEREAVERANAEGRDTDLAEVLLAIARAQENQSNK